MTSTSPPRSYLIVPAFEKSGTRAALQGAADLVVLDLEGTVPMDQKARARIMLRSGLAADWAGDARCVVRLNAWDTKAGSVDRMALSGLHMPAVMLPKVDTAANVAKARAGLTDTDLGASALHVIIETKDGLANVASIAAAGVASVALGAFDLAKELQVEPVSLEGPIYDARQRIAQAAAEAGLWSFDMPWVAVNDDAGFEDHIAQSIALGFTGCCAMNEQQARRINALWAPTDQG